MSSDRELLELAAKAAGIDGAYFHSDNPIHQGIYQARGGYYWNPRVSDSEALRLAVKLRLAIDHNYPQDQKLYVCVSRCEYSPVSELEELEDEGQRGDATRRAIVRAAAEIGKSMP